MTVISILLIIASITSSDTRPIETCGVDDQSCNGRDTISANVASSDPQAESADDAFASSMKFHLLQSSISAKQNDEGANENEAVDQKPRRKPVKMQLAKKVKDEKEEEEEEETKAPKVQTAHDLRKQIASAAKMKMDALRTRLKKDATELKQKLLAKRAPFKVERDLKKVKDKNKLESSPTYQALNEASEKIAEHAAMEKAKQVARERRKRSTLENPQNENTAIAAKAEVPVHETSAQSTTKDGLKSVKDSEPPVQVQKDAIADVDFQTGMKADLVHEPKTAEAKAVPSKEKLPTSEKVDQSSQPKEKLPALVTSGHNTQPKEKLPSVVKGDQNTVSKSTSEETSYKAVAMDHDTVPAKPVHAMGKPKTKQTLTAVPARVSEIKKAEEGEGESNAIKIPIKPVAARAATETAEDEQHPSNIPSKPAAKAATTTPETAPLNRQTSKPVQLEEAGRKDVTGVQDTSMDAGDYYEGGFDLGDLLEKNVHFDQGVDQGELEEVLAGVPSKEGVDIGELQELGLDDRVDEGEMQELADAPSKEEVDLGGAEDMELGSPLELEQATDRHPFMGSKIIHAQEARKKLAEKFVGRGLHGLQKLQKQISTDWTKRAEAAEAKGADKPHTPVYAKPAFKIVDTDSDGKVSPEELNAALSKFNNNPHPHTTTTLAPSLIREAKEIRDTIEQEQKNKAVASVYQTTFKAKKIQDKVQAARDHSADHMAGAAFKTSTEANKDKATLDGKLEQVKNKKVGDEFKDKTEAAKDVEASDKAKEAQASKKYSTQVKKERIAEERQEKLQKKIDAANGKGYKYLSGTKAKTDTAKDKVTEDHMSAKSQFHGTQNKLKSEGSGDKETVGKAVNARKGQLDGAAIRVKKKASTKQKEILENLAAEKSRYIIKMETAQKEVVADKKKFVESIGVDGMESAKKKSGSDAEQAAAARASDKAHLDQKAQEAKDQAAEAAGRAAASRASEKAHLDKASSDIRADATEAADKTAGSRAAKASQTEQPQEAAKVKQEAADAAISSKKAQIDREAAEDRKQVAQTAQEAANARSSAKSQIDMAGSHIAEKSGVAAAGSDAQKAAAKSQIDKAGTHIAEKAGVATAGSDARKAAAGSQVGKAAGDIHMKAGQSAAAHDAAIAKDASEQPQTLPPYQPDKDTLKTITGRHGPRPHLTIKGKVLQEEENLKLTAAARHDGLMQKLQDRKLHLDRVNPKIVAAAEQMRQTHTDAIHKMLVDAPKEIASKIMHRPSSLLDA